MRLLELANHKGHYATNDDCPEDHASVEVNSRRCFSSVVFFTVTLGLPMASLQLFFIPNDNFKPMKYL